MPFSLHSHSGQFCHHASGTLEEMVQAAIQSGLTTYGLSEHMPRQRTQDLYPEEVEVHATPASLYQQFDAYIQEARRLEKKYANQIRILVGMETEYIYPEQLAEIEMLRTRYEIDYVVGSVHHVHGHPIDFDTAMLAKAREASGGTDEALICAYFDAQRDMLQALKPEVVGHFDLIRRFMPPDTHWPESVWKRIRENAAIIAEYGGLVEINTAAWKYGLKDPYPQSAVIDILKRAGCKFTLSDDAHAPKQVATFHDTRLRDYLQQHGIQTVYTLVPRSDQLKNGPFQRVIPTPLSNLTQHHFWTR
jgi:histidinol-phosphatase (PHP family)